MLMFTILFMVGGTVTLAAMLWLFALAIGQNKLAKNVENVEETVTKIRKDVKRLTPQPPQP